METQTISGINVQWPISDLILSGQKTIETRRYPIPKKHVNTPLALIETPGPKGAFKARIRAIIMFKESFEYKTAKDFYQDSVRHCVTPDSVWKWTPGEKKFGWPVKVISVFDTPLEAPKKRGIVFAGGCKIPSTAYQR